MRGSTSRAQSGVARPRPGSGFPAAPFSGGPDSPGAPSRNAERKTRRFRMLVQARQTTRVFDRIVCGVDSSPESLEAARQADRLRASEGLLRLATVADVNVAAHAGFAATRVLGELDAAARDALHAAVDAVHPSSTHLLAGDPVPGLPRRAAAVGCDARLGRAARHSRMLGMLLGGMSTALLHEAPCSVLLARRPRFGPSQRASSAGSTARISHLPPQKWRRPSPSDSAPSWSSLRRQAGSRSISTGSTASSDVVDDQRRPVEALVDFRTRRTSGGRQPWPSWAGSTRKRERAGCASRRVLCPRRSPAIRNLKDKG